MSDFKNDRKSLRPKDEKLLYSNPELFLALVKSLLEGAARENEVLLEMYQRISEQLMDSKDLNKRLTEEQKKLKKDLEKANFDLEHARHNENSFASANKDFLEENKRLKANNENLLGAIEAIAKVFPEVITARKPLRSELLVDMELIKKIIDACINKGIEIPEMINELEERASD